MDVQRLGLFGTIGITILSLGVAAGPGTGSAGSAAGAGTTTTTASTTTVATTTTTTAATTTTTTGGGGQLLNCVPEDVSLNEFASPCGFPDATNTGIQAGVTLTQITSSSTSGTHWACNSPCTLFRVQGNLGTSTTGFELAANIDVQVDNSNSVVTNFKMDRGQIGIPNGTNNFSISHCDLQGAPDSTKGVSSSLRVENGAILMQNGTPAPSGITVDHCHMHGYGTGGGLYEEALHGATVFTNNFVNYENCFSTNSSGRTCSAEVANDGNTNNVDHTNALHFGGGPQNGDNTASVLIQHNTILNDFTNCCETSALSFFNDSCSTSGSPNFFPTCNTAGSEPLQNLHAIIDDNLFSSAGSSGCITLDDGKDVNNVSPPSATALPTSFVQLRWNHFVKLFGCGTSNTLQYPALTNAGTLASNLSHDLNHWGTGDAQCGNVWDDGTFAGTSADATNSYPTTTATVTTCPAEPAWAPAGAFTSAPND